MTKRSGRRFKAGKEIAAFAAIYERLGRGEQLTEAERKELVRLLRLLLAGVDVRRMFYEPVEGAPPENQNAMFIAADVELRKRAQETVKAARGAVAADWKMNDGMVARQHRLGIDAAREWIKREPRDAVAAVVAWHRDRYRN